MKATLYSSSISANLGNSGEAIHKYSVKVFKLSYFLHKHQMKATKNSQGYIYSGHTWVCVMVKLILL